MNEFEMSDRDHISPLWGLCEFRCFYYKHWTPTGSFRSAGLINLRLSM